MRILVLLTFLALIIQATLSAQCLENGIILSTQAGIDNFKTNFPNCKEIEGSVEITGNDITNLNGLSEVISIGKKLSILFNPLLTDLEGLENLTSIGWSLDIEFNDSLNNLDGLEGLESVGSRMQIFYNKVLTSIEGLGNLNTIGGSLSIRDNWFLTSLDGLENIDAESITKLYIWNNFSLSECDVRSICEFLAFPDMHTVVFDNASGCDSVPEIEAACPLVKIQMPESEPTFSIYLNLVKNDLYLTIQNGDMAEIITMYNQIGQIVLQEKQFTGKLNVSMLNPGLYILEVVLNDSRFLQKLIIE